MDGQLALDLLDLVIEVFHEPPKINFAIQTPGSWETVPKSNTKTQHFTRCQKVDQVSQVDHVHTKHRDI